MEDYEIDFDTCCPKCEHDRIHFRHCIGISCNDGYIDISADYYMTEGSMTIKCDECKGTGIERWCPSCGAELSDVKQEYPEEEINSKSQ